MTVIDLDKIDLESQYSKQELSQLGLSSNSQNFSSSLDFDYSPYHSSSSSIGVPASFSDCSSSIYGARRRRKSVNNISVVDDANKKEKVKDDRSKSPSSYRSHHHLHQQQQSNRNNTLGGGITAFSRWISGSKIKNSNLDLAHYGAESSDDELVLQGNKTHAFSVKDPFTKSSTTSYQRMRGKSEHTTGLSPLFSEDSILSPHRNRTRIQSDAITRHSFQRQKYSVKDRSGNGVELLSQNGINHRNETKYDETFSLERNRSVEGIFRRPSNIASDDEEENRQLHEQTLTTPPTSSLRVNDTLEINNNTGVDVSTSVASDENNNNINNSSATNNAIPIAPTQNNYNGRAARTRWIQINKCFQVLMFLVALIFSLLLFCIMICWVLYAFSYFISYDKDCDIPLKHLFWCGTIQLFMEVFRSDIMKLLLRWDERTSIYSPSKVTVYNIFYFVYSSLVLGVGVKSVFFTPRQTCYQTAPELFQLSYVFISLSVGAWFTILVGYVFPFFCVILMLARNGYSPDTNNNARRRSAGSAININFDTTVLATRNPAPQGTIEKLRSLVFDENIPAGYSLDCCICMCNFVPGDVIVETACEHVFHRRCCEQWLQQARSCPVCRLDIPDSLKRFQFEERINAPKIV